jgi:hypothetical protein
MTQPAHANPKKAKTKGAAQTSPMRLAVRERDEQAAQLRRAGATWPQIAKQLGYASAGHAHDRFMILMHEYPRDDIEATRDLEADRLDQLQRALWPKCLAGDQGAITTVLRIMDQRARLLGYNAPVRKEITVLTESVVDKALETAAAKHAEMVAQLEALEQRAIQSGHEILDADVVEPVEA